MSEKIKKHRDKFWGVSTAPDHKILLTQAVR
jgi:hypothetical protein